MVQFKALVSTSAPLNSAMLWRRLAVVLTLVSAGISVWYGTHNSSSGGQLRNGFMFCSAHTIIAAELWRMLQGYARYASLQRSSKGIRCQRERYGGCVDVSIYRRSRESERPVVSTIALIFANRCGEAIINSTGTFFFFFSFGYECTFINTVTLLSVNNHHNKFVSLQLFNRRASRAFHLK